MGDYKKLDASKVAPGMACTIYREIKKRGTSKGTPCELNTAMDG
jgi:hypothetical protein